MDPAIVMCKNFGHGEDGEKIMELGTMDMDGSATEKMDNGDDGREGDEGTRCLSSQQAAAALFVFGDSVFDPVHQLVDSLMAVSSLISLYASLPIIPAYLEPNNDFTHGANFASAGAGALIDSHVGLAVDLQTQLRYFGDLVNHYRQNLGDIESRQLLSDAVYLLSCGGNDYQIPYYPYTQEQYVDIVIGNMTNVIKGIYEKGGRIFGVVNVPLIGCWPGMRVKQPGSTCNTEADELTRLHNQAFAKRLEHLEKQLEGFMYAKFDLSTAISNRMKNPSKYGTHENYVTASRETACCGSGPFGGIYNCGRIKEFELCDNATEYFFFDPFHQNELASLQFAEMFWDGDSMVTQPYNLKALFEAEYAGLPLIPAYLEPRNNEFTYGANFASAGAGALIETRAGFVCIHPLALITPPDLSSIMGALVFVAVLCLSLPTGSQQQAALFVFEESSLFVSSVASMTLIAQNPNRVGISTVISGVKTNNFTVKVVGDIGVHLRLLQIKLPKIKMKSIAYEQHILMLIHRLLQEMLNRFLLACTSYLRARSDQKQSRLARNSGLNTILRMFKSDVQISSTYLRASTGSEATSSSTQLWFEYNIKDV
ncbi:GDSL esterase/lipase 1-like protein [Tanacetum coccineum]